MGVGEGIYRERHVRAEWVVRLNFGDEGVSCVRQRLIKVRYGVVKSKKVKTSIGVRERGP